MIRSPRVSFRDMPTLLAIHAHPDDETITTGGILARYQAEGVRTVVVTCTTGDLGDVRDGSDVDSSSLGSVRLQELQAACDILRVDRSVVLGYRDSGMAGWPQNSDPRCLLQAPLDEVTARLAAVIREERPEVVVTYDEWGNYGHPDHIRTSEAATAAFKAASDASYRPDLGPSWSAARLYYVVFPLSLVAAFEEQLAKAGVVAPRSAPSGADAGDDAARFGVPDARVTTRVDISTVFEEKRAALLAHRTQMTDYFLEQAPVKVLRGLWRYEYFQRALGGSTDRSADPDSSLF